MSENEPKNPENDAAAPPPARVLSAAAQRALAEAAERRRALEEAQANRAKEVNGPAASLPPATATGRSRD